MRELRQGERTASRRAIDKLMRKAGPFKTLVFEHEQTEAQRNSVMRLNAAAVMLNRALAEYSDEGRRR